MDGASTFTDQDSGDLVLDEGLEKGPPGLETGPHFENLADRITGTVIDELSSTVTELVAWDQEKRGPWEEMLAENLDLLGIGPESEADNIDDGDMSNTSDHPLMLTAITRFQSKALSSLLPSPDRVCRTECAFDLEAIEDEMERDELREASDEAGRRVEKYMADYLLKRHKTYRVDTDRILFESGMHGVGFRKVYNDMSRQDQKTRVEQVDVEKLVISIDAKSLSCGRYTEIVDMQTPDLIRNIRNGTYRAVTLTETPDQDEGVKARAENRMQALTDTLARSGSTHRIYEVYLDLFLQEDAHPQGLARPYIMTIHAASQEILSLRRNWQEGDADENATERFVAYIFSPSHKSFLGIGLGHILANITRALRSAQRRGLEAGYLQNHPSGFKMSSLKIRDDGTKVRAGEFVDVDTPVGDIRAALMIQPFQGPSPGLIQLAEKLEMNGKELGGIATIDFSQLMKSGVAAGPAMAAYDESTEFQSAIHSRLYHAHATEMRLIMDRMREIHGQNPVPFAVNSMLLPGDLTMVDLVPVMRPGQVSRQRQILEAQAMLEVSGQYPDIVDNRKAVEDYVKALGKPDVSLYILPDPNEEPPQPMDPATEYANVLGGIPIAAGMMQNHQAHIDAHASQMRMLQTSQLPIEQGEAAMAMLAAHIAEHMGQQMMAEMAMGAGISPDQMGPEMQPEMENQLAPVIAEMTKQIEAERQPPEAQEESKVEVEMAKGQNAAQLATLKHTQAKELQELRAKQEKELQELRDDAAMERSVQDDETAIEIAGMKDVNKSKTRAGGISS